MVLAALAVHPLVAFVDGTLALVDRKAPSEVEMLDWSTPSMVGSCLVASAVGLWCLSHAAVIVD